MFVGVEFSLLSMIFDHRAVLNSIPRSWRENHKMMVQLLDPAGVSLGVGLAMVWLGGRGVSENIRVKAAG
jgi:hypothetical protein